MTNYEKNIEAVKQHSGMGEWIESQEKSEWVVPIKSHDGSENFIIKNNNKKMIAYPIESAKKSCKNDVNVIKKLHKDKATILVGIGNGYILNNILNKCEAGHRILVIEPVADFIKYAFEYNDFSNAYNDGMFDIVTNRDEMMAVLGLLDSHNVIVDWHILCEKYTLFRSDIYGELTKFMGYTLNQILSNSGTVEGAGKIIAKNDIENLPYVIRHPGIKSLFGKFKGKTAIIVSTGPSLMKNIHLLMDEKVRKNCVIIAVAQALRILLGYDIKPDFICTVDFGDINMNHFTGLMDSNVPLIALNRTYAPILKEWQGPKFIVGTPVPGHEDSSSAIIASKGHVEQGGSVAHMALGCAIAFGCKNIIIIGQDLGYESGSSHNPNADAGGYVDVDPNGMLWWRVTDQRSRLHGKSGQKSYSMGPAHTIPGYYGKTIVTNGGLLSFLHVYEMIIERHPKINFVNSTEGGAKIRGAKHMTLKKAIKKYCTWYRRPNKSVIQKELTKFEGHKAIGKAVDIMKSEIDKYNEIIKTANKTIDTLKEMSKKGLSKAEFNKILTKNKKLSDKTEKLAKSMPLINVAIYRETRKISTRKYNVKLLKHKKLSPTNEKNQSNVKKRISRNRLILNAAIREAKKLLEATEKSYNLMKKVYETRDYSLIEAKEDMTPDLSNYVEDFKHGNFAHPYIEAGKALIQDPTNKKARSILTKAVLKRQKAIDMAKKYQAAEDWDNHLEYVKLLEITRKIGKEAKKTNDFSLLEENIKLLKKCIKLKPKEFEARWGLATTYSLVDETEKSLKLYDKLLEEEKDNIDLKFEYATVMIRKDIGQAIRLFRDVFEKTDKYDWYLSRIGDLYMLIGQEDLAIKTYEQYLKDNKNDYEIMKKLADILNKKGMGKEAAKWEIKFRKVLT